ncbi:MAG: hypothetical protein E7544_00820 [Ruminococcaceae bacterium]|nr:hypothetical protein [Oscillospiraceae bacterium]
MKKEIKPSPLMMIIFGVLAVLCVGISFAELVDTYGTSAGTMCMDALVIGVFIYYLIKFLSREKVEFDEEEFTVDGTAYGFDAITDVTVDSEQILRSWSTLRLKIYVGEDEVCTFTKDDKGAKEFIALMEKHGVKIKIYE